MANLYGRMQGYRYSDYPRNQEVTRCGDRAIRADLETWEGKITVELEDDGTFAVYLGEKYGSGYEVIRGNVGNEGRYVLPGDSFLRVCESERE